MKAKLTYFIATLCISLSTYAQNASVENIHKAREYNQAGLQALDNDEFAQAMDLFNKAIQIAPYYPVALLNMGVCYSRTEEYSIAATWYKKVIAISPNDEDALYNLGLAYDKLAEYSEAIQCYKKVIAMNQKDAPTYYRLGRSYFKDGNNTYAIENLQKAARLGHEKAQNLLTRMEAKW